jgi:AraC-like DNA-binding protein
VRRIAVVEAGDEEATRVLMPETGIVVGLRYAGSASVLDGAAGSRVPDATFAGMRDTVRRMRTSAGGGVVLAAFHESGASAIFRVPMHEAFGAILPLTDLLPGSEVERASHRVREARDQRGRVEVLEDLLVARLSPRPDATIEAAVRAIRAAPGAVRIRALAESLGLSQDRLEKRFRRVVGVSPKRLAKLLRVRHAVEAFRAGTRLTSLASAAGYFDQSHFIREFRAVTGDSPGRFLRSDERC